MLSAKKLLSLGLLLSSALSYQTITQTHAHKQNCTDTEMINLLQNDTDNQNPLCSKWNADGQCQQCSALTFFNQKRICVQIDPLCKSFDVRDKRCTACYPGYELSNASCKVQTKKKQENWALYNPLCAVWQNKKCKKCSPKSYLKQNKICVMISPDCKTASQINGYCLSCFDGYQLDKNGQCNKVSEDLWKNKDSLCAKWNQKGRCLQCASRSFRNKDGICQMADPSCYTYSNQTGQCLSCYKGYLVKNGKCIQDTNSQSSSNPYCSSWEGTKCIRCSSRTFLKNGICTPINPQCRTYSELSGECTTCYPGFKIVDGGKCVDSPAFNPNLDPLCSAWQGEKCIQCSQRSYFNKDGFCASVDANCASFNPKNGICLECYSGFQIDSNGKCAIKNKGPSQQQKRINWLCSQWKNQKCVTCSNRSYFNSKGICTQIDPYCQKFSEQKKICLKCYNGYKLKKDLTGCVAPQINLSPIPIPYELPQQPPSKGYDDAYCANWESPTRCRSCASGTYMCETGKCVVYDSNCKKFNGLLKICQQCNETFETFGQKCLKFQKNPNMELQKCVVWADGKCMQCASGLNVNQNGICVCKS